MENLTIKSINIHKSFDDIRKLFAKQLLPKKKIYTPIFSLMLQVVDVKMSRRSRKQIEMQFMADVYLQCEECEKSSSKRFRSEIC